MSKKIFALAILAFLFHSQANAWFLSFSAGGHQYCFNVPDWIHCEFIMEYGAGTVDGHYSPSQITGCVKGQGNCGPLIGANRGGNNIDVFYNSYQDQNTITLKIAGGSPIEVYAYDSLPLNGCSVDAQIEEVSGLVTISIRPIVLIDSVPTLGAVIHELTIDLDDYIGPNPFIKTGDVLSDLSPITTQTSFSKFGEFVDLATGKKFSATILPTRVYNGVEIAVDAVGSREYYIRFGNERHLLTTNGYFKQFKVNSYSFHALLNSDKTAIEFILEDLGEFRLIDSVITFDKSTIIGTYTIPLAPYFSKRQITYLQGANPSVANLYPNPTGGQTTVTWVNPLLENGSLKVVDLSGKTLLSFGLNKGDRSWNLSTIGLQSGQYIVRIEAGSQVYNANLQVIRY